MQLDGGLCILLYYPIESHRILLTSNCIVMPCSVPVNFPAVICLPFMPCCLSKESTSSELWTPVQSIPLIHLPLLLVYLLQTITFHTIRLILCYSKPVSLTTSLIRWRKVLSLCCASLHVASNTCVTFPYSYWFDNLGFLLRETCCCAASYLALGVSNKASHDKCWAPSSYFPAPLPVRLRTSSLGESFTSFLFTLFLVCFVFFFGFVCLFPKKTKKISLV